VRYKLRRERRLRGKVLTESIIQKSYRGQCERSKWTAGRQFVLNTHDQGIISLTLRLQVLRQFTWGPKQLQEKRQWKTISMTHRRNLSSHFFQQRVTKFHMRLVTFEFSTFSLPVERGITFLGWTAFANFTCLQQQRHSYNVSKLERQCIFLRLIAWKTPFLQFWLEGTAR